MPLQPETRYLVAALGAAALIAAFPARAELSAEELAKLAQNPVGNLISVPFQNNTNLNFGPEKGTQNILNIQPVIPIEVNKDWNIITRTIVPVIWMPSLGRTPPPRAASATFGVHGIPVAGQSGSLDLGRRTGHPDSDQQQRGARQQELGARAIGRGAAPRPRRSVGLRRAGQQHLVADQQRARRRLQQRTRSSRSSITTSRTASI